MADVKAIPDGYPRVSPHLSVVGAADAIEFYKSVLGASERFRMAAPGGTIAHGELQIGDSVVMIGDEMPGGTDPSSKTLGGSPVALFVYVEDVDDVFRRAIEAGATSVSDPEDHFYGHRVGMFDDPWGHRWTVATHVEDVAPDEMERRAAEVMAAG